MPLTCNTFKGRFHTKFSPLLPPGSHTDPQLHTPELQGAELQQWQQEGSLGKCPQVTAAPGGPCPCRVWVPSDPTDSIFLRDSLFQEFSDLTFAFKNKLLTVPLSLPSCVINLLICMQHVIPRNPFLLHINKNRFYLNEG